MDNETFISRLKQYGDVSYDESGTVVFTMKPLNEECKLGCRALVFGQSVEVREYQKPCVHVKKKCSFCKKWQLPNGEMTGDHVLLRAEWDKELRRTGQFHKY